MPGAALRSRHCWLGACVVLVVLAATITPARAAMRTAPDALPQMWGLEVDRATLRLLDAPLLERLQSGGITLVVTPGSLNARQRARTRKLARRWNLAVFKPARVHRSARATCRVILRARAVARCGVLARSPSKSRKLGRVAYVDVVVARVRGSAGFRKLDDGAGSARFLGIGRLTKGASHRRSWRRTILAAQRSQELDLVARLAGKKRKRALVRHLDAIARLTAEDRTPPSVPPGLRVTAAGARAMSIAWDASLDDVGVVRYGLYRDGARRGAAGVLSKRFRKVDCAHARLAVDAVDAAGNRSAKRPLARGPANCRPTSSPPRGPVGPSGDPQDTLPASVFVAVDGDDAGTCTQAAPCRTFGRAYDVAQPGEIVEVAGGAYPGQTIQSDGPRSGENVWFRKAAGSRVIIDGLTFGEFGGDSSKGPQRVTVKGMEGTYRGTEPGAGNQEGIFIGPGSSHVMVKEMDFGSVNTYLADNVKVVGGDYGPCHAIAGTSNVCSNSKLDASTNVLIDGARFHDYRFDESCWTAPGADCHWECLFINGGTNNTVRNSVFHGCAIFDIFTSIYGDAEANGHRNLTIENNFFAAPWHETSSGSSLRSTAVSIAWCQNSPNGYQDVFVRFNSFQRNATVQVDQNPSCVFNNIQIVGNLMMYEDCQSVWTFRNNVFSTAWRTGTCNASDRIAGDTFPYVNGGADSALDYHLTASSVADNLVPVAAGCPATDIDGQPRGSGGFCDAGADER